MSYFNTTEVESAIANIAGAYPGLTSLVTLPEASIEGRTIHALRISSGGFGTRDVVMMIGGVHAREWGSCEILINFATDLLAAATTNQGLQYGGKTYSAVEVQGLFNSLEFVILPLVNPDGRHYSQQHDAAILAGWRKNRNPASSGGDPNKVGVDINRNYDFLWDFTTKMKAGIPAAAASADPTFETFHGTAPFSEPETRNVRWLLDAVPRTRWFIDVHSYSQLILYNWGDDQNQSNDPAMNFRNPAWDGQRGGPNDAYREYIPSTDEQVAAALAGRMKAGIAAVRGINYTPEPSFSLYPTSGASDDYVYSRHWNDPSRSKIYGFVLEWGQQFHPAWSEMELIIDDVTSGLLAFCASAPCAGGTVGVGPLTNKLAFVDVPAGTETARAAVFSVESCQAVTLQVTGGPSLASGPGTLGLPLGGIVSLPAQSGAVPREARIWVSYRAGAAGTTASGSITISCPQTAQQWTIPITANAVAKPTVASMLVLDKSGSMDFPSGIPGKRRIDVLHDSAPTFVELLGNQDGVGVVAFDQDASLSTPVAQAGSLGFGAGRAAAVATIANHVTNPAGSTSIGDGVGLGHDTLAVTAGYQRRAIVVLTDGEENASKFISDVAAKIDDRVFAIGLGTVNQLNPIALNRLVNNTGGYMMLTGPLTASEQFRVAKYFLQILSGVTNNQIVVDPDSYLAPGDTVRVPFSITDADTSMDVILLSQYRRLIDFSVEAPTGDIIDPASVSSLVGSEFVAGTSLDAYRLTLPAVWQTHGAHRGVWNAVVRLGDIRRPGLAAQLRDAPQHRAADLAHGIPVSITVQAESSLTMSAHATPRSAEPSTTIDHDVRLRQLDIPLDTTCSVELEATDPNGVTTSQSLPLTAPGAFAAMTSAPIGGVYTFRYLARGLSLAGAPFMREQVRTVAVWDGGNEAPPRDTGGDACCRELLRCLVTDRGVQRLLKRYGIDGRRIQRCSEQAESA